MYSLQPFRGCCYNFISNFFEAFSSIGSCVTLFVAPFRFLFSKFNFQQQGTRTWRTAHFNGLFIDGCKQVWVVFTPTISLVWIHESLGTTGKFSKVLNKNTKWIHWILCWARPKLAIKTAEGSYFTLFWCLYC